MGAPNFGRLNNAGAIYSLGMDTEEVAFVCQACGEQDYDLNTLEDDTVCSTCGLPDVKAEVIDYGYDNYDFISDKSCIREALSNKFDVINGSEEVCICKDYSYAGADFTIEVELEYESGYHQGVRVDYSVGVTLADYTYPVLDRQLSEEILAEELVYNEVMNAGMAAIHCKGLNKFVNKKIEELLLEVDAVMEEATLPLVKVYQFSNGEARYAVKN